MITYWKYAKILTEIKTFEENCILKVTAPVSEEIDALTTQFQLDPSIFSDILDLDERSRLEVYDDKILIILRIPIHHPDNGIPFTTLPLGIVLHNEYTIIICQKETELLNSVFYECNTYFSNLTQMDFVLSLWLQNSKLYHNYLKKINIQTNLIEEDLEKSTRNKELHKLLKMEKCLVYFTTSLRSNELLLAKIRNSRHINADLYNEDILEDVIIENKQAIEMAKIYSDILSGMMDAFASVISNNLNQVMKQLTIVTIILMIPTLIASFFGMNILNPFEHTHFAFMGIVAGSLILSGLGIYMIRIKKWG